MTEPSTRSSVAFVLLLAAIWAGGQLAWLAADERIAEGDALGNVGAVELFMEDHEGRSAAGELIRSYTEDFGEYPALYPAATGVVARWLGVRDLDGDGPARAALLWAALALAATFVLGRELGGNRAAVLGTAALMLSPLWTALQRHVMLENGVCALVAVAAAAGFTAVGADGRRRRTAAWAVVGVSAGLALLVKQTAILALAPLGVALVLAQSQNRLRGPAIAGGCALVIAAPWYARRLGGEEGEYLLRSFQSNPDAVGPLHQLAYYPLVLLQQPWAPIVVLAGIAVFIVARRGGTQGESQLGRPSLRYPLGMVLGGVVLAMLVPKKYPRLLLPLLPVLCAVMGCWLSQLPTAMRRGLLTLATLSALVIGFSGGRAGAVLAEGRLGLVEVDERCYQDWLVPPSSPGLDFDAVLRLLEEAGGAGTEYRVGSPKWPVPPCAHQTSLNLGEHLRIRVRRAGMEAFVVTEPLADEPPTVLVTDGRFACADQAGVCAPGAVATSVGSVELKNPEWPLVVHVWRVGAR